MKELDTGVLTVDLPEHHLEKGDVGTVVHVYDGGVAYEVEFLTTSGKTIAVEKLTKNQLRPASGENEIIHVRALA
jgi:hypothetical protein